MTAKEYLMQYKDIKELLRQTNARLADIQTELAGLEVGNLRSPWPDGQPRGTGTTDPTGNQAAADADRMTEKRRAKLRARLEDLKIEAHRERMTLWEKREEIEATIGSVPNATLKEILHRHYIAGESFELISVMMNYSYRHTIRLHGDALILVGRMLKK